MLLGATISTNWLLFNTIVVTLPPTVGTAVKALPVKSILVNAVAVVRSVIVGNVVSELFVIDNNGNDVLFVIITSCREGQLSIVSPVIFTLPFTSIVSSKGQFLTLSPFAQVACVLCLNVLRAVKPSTAGSAPVVVMCWSLISRYSSTPF